MATSAQILANRENAQLSTGPTTPEGKRAISLNAVRHGLTGRTLVLTPEDNIHYDRIKSDYLHDYSPANTVERTLVQTLTDTTWRLERSRAHEMNLLSLGHLEGQPDYILDIPNPEAQTAFIEALNEQKYEKALRNLGIQEARLNRIFLKTVEQLHKLQAERRRAEKDAALLAAQEASRQSAREPAKEHAKTPQSKAFAATGFVFANPETPLPRPEPHRLHLVPPSPAAPVLPTIQEAVK